MARDQFTELLRRVADLERRINNIVRPARITKVDAKKATCRVAYALDPNGKEVESFDIPWQAQAGNITSWTPPTKDQQVFLFSPGGDIGLHSWVMPGGYCDKFPAPHDKEDEAIPAMVNKNGKRHYHIYTEKGIHAHTPAEKSSLSATVYMKKNGGDNKGVASAETPPEAEGLT